MYVSPDCPRRSTSWYSQPYTGGSYTAIGRGGTQADIEKVAEPLYIKTKKNNKVGECCAFHLQTALAEFFSRH